MTPKSEQIEFTPHETRLAHLFQDLGQLAVDHFYELQGGEEDQAAVAIHEAEKSEGLVLLYSTQRYNRKKEDIEMSAMRRPFVIDLDTLSDNVQLVLYPKKAYSYLIKDKQEGSQFQVRTEGPQGVLYVLDGFEQEASRIEDCAANLHFIAHMTNALLQGRFPFETGERSEEFLGEVRAGLESVRSYVAKLNDEQRARLSPRIARLVTLDVQGLTQEARNYVRYHVEPIKAPGLIEDPRTEAPQETPEEAMRNRTPYLHVSERDLPQRVIDRDPRDVPSLPWIEYGENRWTRDYQLFGRYELTTDEYTLLVDFRLDSTHMPARYGFFDTIEIIRRTSEGILQHIILGQEVAGFSQVFPIIVAGDFDFIKSETRQQLEMLAKDKGTKPDVGRVIADVLLLSAEGRLQRVSPA